MFTFPHIQLYTVVSRVMFPVVLEEMMLTVPFKVISVAVTSLMCIYKQTDVILSSFHYALCVTLKCRDSCPTKVTDITLKILVNLKCLSCLKPAVSLSFVQTFCPPQT